MDLESYPVREESPEDQHFGTLFRSESGPDDPREYRQVAEEDRVGELAQTCVQPGDPRRDGRVSGCNQRADQIGGQQ